MSYYSKEGKRTALDIIIIAAIIFGFIGCMIMLDQVVNGQTQNITSPPAPAPQELEQVVEDVPAIADQVDSNTTLTGVIGAAVSVLSTYAGGKFLKDRKDKHKIEEYASATDKLIFNHVMDNYNDFATLTAIEARILEETYQPHNANLTYKQVLDIVIDSVTGETLGMKKKRLLNKIIEWNKEYYGSPSADPNITCPDPKNKVARTMTDIKKLSVPSTIEPQQVVAK